GGLNAGGTPMSCPQPTWAQRIGWGGRSRGGSPMFIQAEPAHRDVELALDSTRLRVGDHVGVFYRGAEERDGIAIPLIGEALAAGCGVIYVCDVDAPEAVKSRLVTEAIDVDGAIKTGQLRVVTSTDVYTPD